MLSTVEIPLLLAILSSLLIVSADISSTLHPRCDCMDYWKCALNGGETRGMCPMSSQFCCFMPTKQSGLIETVKPLDQLSILSGRRNSRRCGEKGGASVTVTDGISEAAEWPWHCAVLEVEEDLYVCGASLLNERWLLTAAHCLDNYISSSEKELGLLLKVRLGEYDVSSLSEKLRHQEIPILDIIVHPKFDNSTLVNDIALIRMSRAVERQENIGAVCLAPQTDQTPDHADRTDCIVTGWGRHNETSSHSVVLKEIAVPVWPRTACSTSLQLQFGPDYTLPDTALCAGARHRDACDGDGGGPLVCEKAGVWYQVGIVSFGIGCGRENVPGVYTKVSAFNSWILRTVQSYDLLNK